MSMNRPRPTRVPEYRVAYPGGVTHDLRRFAPPAREGSPAVSRPPAFTVRARCWLDLDASAGSVIAVFDCADRRSATPDLSIALGEDGAGQHRERGDGAGHYEAAQSRVPDAGQQP